MDFKVYSNDDPRPELQLPKWLKPFSWIAGFIFVLFLLFLLFMNLFAEYVWMESLGFGQVFATILGTRIALFIAGFCLYAGVIFLTIHGIRQVYLRSIPGKEIPPIIKQKWLFLMISIGVASFFGLLGSSVVQGLGWERILTFLNQDSFQLTEPIFSLDVSFYVYSLPFYNFVLNTLMSLFMLVLIVQTLAFSVFQLYMRSWLAKIQLSISIVVFGLCLAAKHFLARFETLLSNQVNAFQTSSVYGVSHTDQLINIPWTVVMTIVTIIAIVLLCIGLFRSKISLLIAAPILYIAVLLVGQAGSMVVQNFIVTPNEFNVEREFLPDNISFTQQAYGLVDIAERQHPGLNTLSEDMVERNSLTFNNVRVNDSRPLLDIYNQLDTMRTYYRFNDVDVDRYEINGEYKQVFVSARELDTTDLPDQAQTWTNQVLRYTHGYGVAMSHVSAVDSTGRPEYILQDLPIDGDIDVTRPQIYFGEQHNYRNVIVNTNVEEFDYPTDSGNETYQFSADTGIPMSLFHRFLYAWEEKSFRILFTNQIDADSQLLRKRNILERVHSIAPFLQYDSDPYIVVRDDGTLVWIIDAYTTSNSHPYAEPVERGSFNYLRNPIKVVVDAYTGEVDLYLIDPDEPMARTYANIFPDLFTLDIPDDIFAHFRYPVDLFKYQAMMFRSYHMSDLEVFYNREDFWQFAREKYYDRNVIMEPYYITMQLPDEDQEEFILMQPFTPNNRQNLIAWLGVRNDGEHYGELILNRFPRQRTVLGPQQIENRIDNDSFISQQLTLWDQGGANVIRGNLIVIPIEDTVLYVEPIYIEADSASSLPEVRQIIVGYGDHIVMENNFENAMNTLLAIVADGVPIEEIQEGTLPAISVTAEELVEQLTTLFERYQIALSAGSWEESGRILAELENKLQEWQQEQDAPVEEDSVEPLEEDVDSN